MLAETILAGFARQLRGQLIQPHDAVYTDACKVYNGMIHKQPAFIVQCADVADVMASVRFAKEQDLLLAVRGGGHNGGGLGTCDNGLVIDLSRMRSVIVDAATHTVTAEGGCTLADIDHATQALGLAVPGGIVSSTGIGGLTLIGGLGHLTRQYGLTIDSLLQANMVLADGSYVQASADNNSDLFWAIRGGGGNFGIVTSFVFKAHPVQTVYGGPMFWHLDDAKKIMRWYREWIKQAPEYENGFFAFTGIPPAPMFPEQYHRQTMCAIVWCCNGGKEASEKLFATVRAFLQPVIDFAGPLPFTALQSLFDPILPPGLQWYWKGDYIDELPDEAIDTHVQFARQLPTWQSTMHLYPINGAAARVAPDATPWHHRNSTWALVIAGISDDARNNNSLVQWARSYHQALQPYSAGAAYLNFIMDEGAPAIKAAYGSNYQRLVAIKTKYDPQNLFRVNQNIQPEPVTAVLA